MPQEIERKFLVKGEYKSQAYSQDRIIQGFVSALGVSNPFTFVVAFVGVQGLIEAVVCFVLAGAISRTLGAALHRA